MSYLVLARKYRPRRFADLVGQEHVARTLANAFALDRVHHAYLFTGSRGVGKTSSARILAMALSCDKGPTPDPCGVCDACREIAAGQSVDIIEIDGASNGGVEEARNLREGVRYAPSARRKKVYIIDEVHMLSSAAFNALLKTIEEPPPYVVFILATTEVHKIPATILSRVQRYDFKLVGSVRLAEHLTSILKSEGIAAEDDAVRLLARQAQGSVRDALSLLDQVIAFVGGEPLTAARVAAVLGVADKQLLFALCDAVLARDPGAALRAFAGALERGIDPTQIARALLGFLHDVELAGLLDDPRGVVDCTEDELAEAKALSARTTRGMFRALFDRWARAVDEGGRASSPRLIYEMGLVDLCFCEPLLPLGDLLPRLEELENRLSGSAPLGASGGAAPVREPVRPRASVAVAPASVLAPSALASVAPAPPHRAAPPSPALAALSPPELWARIQDALMHESPMLAAALEHAELENVAPGQLTVLMADKFQAEQVEKGRLRLETLISELLGQPTRLLVRQGKSAAPVMAAPATVTANALEDDKRRREDEARNHPMIQKAQDLFGARVSGVKT